MPIFFQPFITEGPQPIMKINRQSRQWQMLLGTAELATVMFYAWDNARRVSRKAAARELRGEPVAAPVAKPDPAKKPVASAEKKTDHVADPLDPAIVDHPVHGKALKATPGQALKALANGHGFSLKELGQIAIDAAKSWSVHRAASKGAALALYTLFSLAPMLVLVVAVAGLFFGVEAVRDLIMKQMSGVLGTQGSEGMKSILAGAHFESDSKFAAMISAGILLIGATSAFAELKNSLDELWEVPPSSGGGLWSLIRERFLSFGLVLVLALMLLISLAVSAALSALGDVWIGGVGNESFVWFAKIISAVVSFGIVTAMFAAIYKYLPAVRIAWGDVIVGSVITAILFVSGKFLLAWYLGKTDFSSGYGAAGSLVLLVTWIYYSAQIFFYGALFTHEHAVRSGRATPTEKPADGELPSTAGGKQPAAA